jgi:4-amino-4-deoxy-L-arabinose transferase-like glycosyltransferase
MMSDRAAGFSVSFLSWFRHRIYILWLFLIVTLTYAPFIGSRVIRMAGDEKVYVSQAIEMAQKGHWFLQTLQGQPDYYKGPLHYILLRIGMLIFGWNTWAVLYMNYLLVFAGACALGALVRKHYEGPSSNGLAVWTGAFFATCTGVYTHFFASQMEAELAGLFAIAFYLLDSTPIESAGLPFWLVAGLIGWSKSPLHAGFAGVSAVLFWFFTGELGARLRNWKSWAAAAAGVLFCVAGYLPAYLYDRQNFIDIYIIRETFSKGDSGQSWTVSFESVLGFYLFPWLLLAFVAYTEFLSKIVQPWKYFFTPKSRRALWLAFSGVLPSFLFFAWHPYHFENYDLPVISGVVLFVAINFGQRTPFFEKLYRVATLLTALVLLILPFGLTVLSHRFEPLAPWWPAYLVPLAWIGTLVSASTLVYCGVIKKFQKLEWIAAGMIGFFLAMGATISVIGERELFDLRQFLRSPQGESVHEMGYYNLQHNIWSEWGFLNFWLGNENVKVVGLHEPADLKRALESGEVVLVPAKGPQEDFKQFVKKEEPSLSLEILPWKRWRTQGKSPSGDPLWKEAWQKRDISVLETDYLIVRLKTAKER